MTELATLAPALPVVVAHSPGAREATGGWLMYLSAKSIHTQVAYMKDLEAWLAFCHKISIDPLTARGRHLDAWVAYMLRDDEDHEPAAPTSVNRRLASVSSWYRYLVREEALAANPVAAVERLDVDNGNESTTIGLDRDQVRALLKAARDDTHVQACKTRNLALVTMLINNGLRCGEAMRLDDEDLSSSRGHRTIRIKGKGSKTRTAPLAPATSAALDAYLTERSAEPGPLFRTATGKALDHKAMFRLVRRLARLADLTDVMNRISPHSLRHTAITAALDAGVSLRDVQDFARHADPKTTRRYDRNRHSLDRNATYAVAAFLTDVTTP